MSDTVEFVVHEPQYVTWDFERKQAIAYERHGECKKCGACCLGSIRIEGNGAREPRRGSIAYSGVWYEPPEDEKGRQHYRINAVEHDGKVCNCLKDKLCGSRDNGAYAPICQDWPVSPDHQLIYPTCGYKFVEVGRWEMED